MGCRNTGFSEGTQNRQKTHFGAVPQRKSQLWTVAWSDATRRSRIRMRTVLRAVRTAIQDGAVLEDQLRMQTGEQRMPQFSRQFHRMTVRTAGVLQSAESLQGTPRSSSRLRTALENMSNTVYGSSHRARTPIFRASIVTADQVVRHI